MGGKTILVTGDVSCDVNIFKGKKTASNKVEQGTVIKKEPGGAYLLFEIIESIKKNDPKLSKHDLTFGYKKGFKRLSSFPDHLTSYATWQLFGDNQGWKVFDVMGFGYDPPNGTSSVFFEKHLATDIKTPEILVIDDGAGQFRNQPQLWEHLFRLPPGFEHVVLKICSPVAKGKLFNRLLKMQKELSSLVIIVSLEEIRNEDVLISRGVSWEQTALDLIYELTNNTRLKHLLNANHLIIPMGSEGALYLFIKNKKLVKARLVFDPTVQEGEWELNLGPGGLIGLMSCFTAGVVTELMSDSDNFDFAITRGLSLQRRYKLCGRSYDSCAFPFKDISNEAMAPAKNWFASAVVPIPDNTAKADPKTKGLKFKSISWTILEGNYLPDKNKEPLFDVGLRLAINGEKELANVPHLRVNHFLTYDRSEIESLRNIKNLINDYIENDPGKKPLSLAVFGAPGAGKSFAVNQIAESQGLPFVEFNLSQFEDANELIGAFHQVRDVVLKGKAPIVFWDEFDSQKYRWLQYLLAPMQDGKFQEGQITHPIGKCIFIFAGGTSYSFNTFGAPEPQYPEKGDVSDRKIMEYETRLTQFKEFKLKKGPDFKSRLTGYLNVMGPNQLEELDEYGNVKLNDQHQPVKDKNDVFFPIRRALFIRAIFGKKGNENLEGDYGLINALIKVDKFKHGSRSLEKILTQIKMKSNGRIKRSGLPAFNILSMLVDYDQFIKLMDEKNDFQNQIHAIAPLIHKNWLNLGDKQGWKLEYHKPYKLLPSHIKDDNVSAASRIPKILSIIHLKIVPKDEADLYEKADFKKILQDESTLTKLSKAEHEGWDKFKESRSWKHSAIRNDDQKKHDCMVEWDKLPDKEKDKDKDAVKNYERILDQAGFIIVKADA